MNRERPFCGAAAVAAGLVTPKQLRGPRFRSPFRGVYLGADVTLTYLLLCEAAALSVGALDVRPPDRPGPAPPYGPVRTALAGWSAAEVLGADCAPQDVPAEVVVTDGHRRNQDGLRVAHVLTLPGEVQNGVPIPDPDRPGRVVPGRTVTTVSALRAAFDLARRESRIDAVIALDALSRVGGFRPDDVLAVAAHHPGARGVARLPELVALASPLAESPMETRVRLALHDHGVPAPVLQHPVGRYRIDLAYPHLLFGIEYDGEHHLDPRQAREDLMRQAFLTSRGWTILRPDGLDVFHRPDHIAGVVRHRLARLHAATQRP